MKAVDANSSQSKPDPSFSLSEILNRNPTDLNHADSSLISKYLPWISKSTGNVVADKTSCPSSLSAVFGGQDGDSYVQIISQRSNEQSALHADISSHAAGEMQQQASATHNNYEVKNNSALAMLSGLKSLDTSATMQILINSLMERADSTSSTGRDASSGSTGVIPQITSSVPHAFPISNVGSFRILPNVHIIGSAPTTLLHQFPQQITVSSLPEIQSQPLGTHTQLARSAGSSMAGSSVAPPASVSSAAPSTDSGPASTHIGADLFRTQSPAISLRLNTLNSSSPFVACRPPTQLPGPTSILSSIPAAYAQGPGGGSDKGMIQHQVRMGPSYQLPQTTAPTVLGTSSRATPDPESQASVSNRPAASLSATIEVSNRRGRGRGRGQLSRGEPSYVDNGVNTAVNGRGGRSLSWRSKYDEIDRLENEVKQKKQLIVELEEEGRQLVRKERLLKIQVANSERTMMSHNLDKSQIPESFTTKDFISSWQKLMEEVTNLMLEISASLKNTPAKQRLLDLDDRIWDWMVSVCVHYPAVIMEAQDLSMQNGEAHTAPMDFWVMVVGKLQLTSEQTSDLIEVTRLCSTVLSSLTEESAQSLHALLDVTNDALLKQWDHELRKSNGIERAFNSLDWANRMDKQEGAVRKFLTIWRRNQVVNFMASFLMNRLLTPVQRMQLYFSSFPSFPRFKLIMAAVFMSQKAATSIISGLQ
ncbi:hypothetical protein CEUSTIGMA_g12904.t1 [Chlamydomonas eustigma]|uniref:Uncharacterized protein n=1 Tax=Chlamydomonas eustigma TaxID=1157962 RepID=A0A250XR02_9CHLO|nr:hypothetical protein CEUSTIGMA_g12904.t1 [Chlamydomonas eustigma]|eukprot:GAX85488.1 hypothetical protein CEUSTIGMA_g12904.t1 [Chlamydomonas eustigma]